MDTTKLQRRAARFNRTPLAQLAYEAWSDLVLTKKPGADESAWRWEQANLEAVRAGIAEPLPQYRPLD